MRLPPLTKMQFVHRPNRFVVELKRTDTEENVLAHLPDPGRLRELLVEGAIIWAEPAVDPLRKTAWTAVLCETPGGDLVSLKTTFANQLVEEALASQSLEAFSGWQLVKREATIGQSRFDFLLSKNGRTLVLEVKSVTLARGSKGFFPDAVTKRGAKHVRELTALNLLPEYESAVLFVSQHSNISTVEMESSIDADFAKAIKEANDKGMFISAVSTELSKQNICLKNRIPVVV
ncbi:DNA/RNA nuclease SfsA [Shouchella clausii]|uniref:DNA/RNA nuclease SfsA n=1 Tax=Shouchella clausii TaxID=79880 RepID=UPI000BA6C1D1|nr:DNA/RNA nuclease SfsA [Shouchella clausii]PAE94114.1 DNA/RNA nuclease SfsA [Shouchella clausii]